MPNPLTLAVHAAARKLLTLQMTDIRGEPTKADALALIDDLRVIWETVDPLIEAVGRYAQSNFGLSERDMADFRGQLQGALEGNATFRIEDAIDAMTEDRLNDEADYRFKSQREAAL